MDAIITSIVDIVTVVDMEGKIVRMNPMGSELAALISGPPPTTLA